MEGDNSAKRLSNQASQIEYRTREASDPVLQKNDTLPRHVLVRNLNTPLKKLVSDKCGIYKLIGAELDLM